MQTRVRAIGEQNGVRLLIQSILNGRQREIELVMDEEGAENLATLIRAAVVDHKGLRHLTGVVGEA